MERWEAKMITLVGVFIIPIVCTLLPIKVHEAFVKKGKRGEMYLSWLMCFGGGVFFATFLLHMAPEVKSILEHSLLAPNGITYPVAEVMMASGFFIVLFIEKMALKWHRKKKMSQKAKCEECPFSEEHEHANGINGEVKFVPKVLDIEDLGGVIDESISLQPSGCKEVDVDGTGVCQNDHTAEQNKEHVIEYLGATEEEIEMEHGSRSLVLIIALSLHRIFEGMSVGLQRNTSSVFSLFGAVMCHEAVIGFSLGLQFVRNNFSTKRHVVYSIICSLIMPIGLAVGTAMTETGGSESNGINIVNGVLQAMSTGTFIYVTFFEILNDEITHHDTSLSKPISLVLGFGVMALISLVPEPVDPLTVEETHENVMEYVNGVLSTVAP